MTIADPVQLIIDLLLAESSVTDLVDDRVGREIPEGDGNLMPRACIIVTRAGGRGRRGTLKLREARIDTACYGATLKESGAVHDAVRELLEEYVHDGDLITVETSSDGVNARHPDTQWPVCYASYRVTTAV